MHETVLTFDRKSDAPRAARRQIHALAPPGRVDDATLLVSELVTNAVRYGPETGQFRVIVSQDDVRTCVTVQDAGLGPRPELRAEDDPDGLRLVDALADRWGVERGSTRVWFELDR